MGFEEETDDFANSAPKDSPPWFLITLFTMTCVGAGLFFTIRSGVFDGTVGIPIPSIGGETAFTVNQQSLAASSIFTRDDGSVIHYMTQPGVVAQEQTGDENFILADITQEFGLSGPIHPQDFLFGKEFHDDCSDDTIHVKKSWIYIYKDRTFTEENQGNFLAENFYLGPCGDLPDRFSQYPSRANASLAVPMIEPGNLVLIAVPSTEVEKVNAAIVRGGSTPLQLVIGYDSDGDGLVEQHNLTGGEGDADTDGDGISDGEEITGSALIASNTTDWNDADTDGDGIPDGIELGRPENTDTGFAGDADDTTTTDPANPDSDGGGLCDGPNTVMDDDGTTELCTSGEDMNADGKVDEGETDPSIDLDDIAEPIVCDPVCDATNNEKCVDNNGTPECGDPCGDGVVDDNVTGEDFGEECDDGNQEETDTCNNSCELTSCGDGTVQDPNGANESEQCDDGAENGTAGKCNATCDGTEPILCGTVACTADQKCVNDGSTQTCIDPCGDGVVDDNVTGEDFGEECDDGNADETDACTNSCLDAVCGDGFHQSAGKDGIEGDDAATTDVDESADDETCDDGNTDETDACLSDCSLPQS